MSSSRLELQKLISKWQQAANRDSTDQFKYEDLLDDLLFQADMRFRDYVQFDIDGPFPFRLKKWLCNLSSEQEQKALFRLLHWMIFIDNKQMQSLYRDAYRSKVVAWVAENSMDLSDLLAPDYQRKLLTLLKQYYFCSITESFNVSFFKQVNSLVGLPKLEILGERISVVQKRLEEMVVNKRKKGLIIFEDMVGTGNQAIKVLRKIVHLIPINWQCLFIPLIILNSGLKRLKQARIKNLDIYPVLVIPKHKCVQQRFQKGEPAEFKYSRYLIKTHARRVMEAFHEYDDVPNDAFGYEGSGALAVTSHNTPNNTLPIIHHRAPDWEPLFRRIHHFRDV